MSSHRKNKGIPDTALKPFDGASYIPFLQKNRIIAELKALYPEDEWDFSPLIRDKFFGGRQVNREYSLSFLDQMRED